MPGKPRWFELIGSEPARERTARSLASDGSMIVRREGRIFLRVGWKHVKMVSGTFIGEGDTKLVEIHMPPNQYIETEQERLKPTSPTAQFRCNVCSKRFVFEEDLISHIDEVHRHVERVPDNYEGTITRLERLQSVGKRLGMSSNTSWTLREDELIIDAYCARVPIAKIMVSGRSTSAIKNRLDMLRSEGKIVRRPTKPVPPPAAGPPPAVVQHPLTQLLDEAANMSLRLSILLEEVRNRVGPISELLRRMQ